MFYFFKKRKRKRYTEEASVYVQETYITPVQTPDLNPPTEKKDSPKSSNSGVRFSISGTRLSEIESDVRYSERETTSTIDKPSNETRYSLKKSVSGTRVTDQDIQDRYNASKVTNLLRSRTTSANVQETLRVLEQNVNQTFVDKLLQHIREKGLRDSAVYKSAQIDKRLFSKMISNHEYRPSKDTAIALALALKLSLDDANDMLSRAGYTFSHSNKRDIIIEFFFREKIYNLFDLNEVLYNLNQKLIGRF